VHRGSAVDVIGISTFLMAGFVLKPETKHFLTSVFVGNVTIGIIFA